MSMKVKLSISHGLHRCVHRCPSTDLNIIEPLWGGLEERVVTWPLWLKIPLATVQDFFFLKDLFLGFLPLIDRTVKVWTGNEMERRGGEWDREMTAGRIRTRVPVGVQARTWSGLLLAPQCPPTREFNR